MSDFGTLFYEGGQIMLHEPFFTTNARYYVRELLGQDMKAEFYGSDIEYMTALRGWKPFIAIFNPYLRPRRYGSPNEYINEIKEMTPDTMLVGLSLSPDTLEELCGPDSESVYLNHYLIIHRREIFHPKIAAWIPID
ncbi:hypothetical protein JXC34_04485, partial [Candidatus Woesearchaeota archaeon]|nr:hypothetical protein [Candidatus Woesearchaeota archaeon]